MATHLEAADVGDKLRTRDILVVDDSSLIRLAIRGILHGHSGEFAVHEAEDGHEAVRRAGEIKPDVILLDLAIPPIPGPQLAAHLLEGSPSSTIVIISEQDPCVLQKLTSHLGLEKCIAKSNLASELLPMLRTIARDSLS